MQMTEMPLKVMLSTNHTKWNFDVLQELIEGPLLHPKRMEEAIKVGRFIRRLLAFFHPFSHRFSDMENNKVGGSKSLTFNISIFEIHRLISDG